MLSYSALGMREGVLIQLSKQKDDDPSQPAIYSSAIVFTIAIGVLLPVVCTTLWVAGYAHVDSNYLLICLIAGTTVLNEVLININRYEANLMRVAFCEVSYNVLILGLILILHKIVSVSLVLSFMLAAIAFSVSIYLMRLRFFSLRKVSWPVVQSLIASGFPSSVLSALLIVLNLIFILVAQQHLPQTQVGQFVFANNIATLLMVSLNAFSWAMTSRSMNDLATAHEGEKRRASILRTDMYLRIGLAGALFLALAASFGLPWVTERYADSGRYVLLFVALQAFQIIIFTELNFLMMKNRLGALIAIFAVTNLVNFLLIEGLSGRAPFYVVMIGAIFCTTIATLAVMKYATYAGLDDIRGGTRYSSVLAIPLIVVLFYSVGVIGAMIVAGLFLVSVVFSYRKDLLPLLA